jgi:hypothetical protein
MNWFKRKKAPPRYKLGQKVYWKNDFNGQVYLCEIVSVDDSKEKAYIIKAFGFGNSLFAVSEQSLWIA